MNQNQWQRILDYSWQHIVSVGQKNIHRYIYATMSMKNFLIMFPSPYQLHAVLVLDDFISKIISLHLVVYSMSILVK